MASEVREKWRSVLELNFLKIIEWPLGMNECPFWAPWILGGVPDPVSSQHTDFLCTLAMYGCPPLALHHFSFQVTKEIN